jgi:hypothetical protein
VLKVDSGKVSWANEVRDLDVRVGLFVRLITL